MERLMTLENSYCSISVDPERGAKITSIRYKQQDREILLVPDTIDEIPTRNTDRSMVLSSHGDSMRCSHHQ